jgi:flavin reductase (DIM6/NTAB) family NADH-FMN oxidoreductase RutF
MFYDAIANKHGLKRDPWKAVTVPRPIGWVSTVSKDGICNLAPYSYFNAVSDRPHYVYFASQGMKDSVRNAEETGEFVCSLVTFDLRHEMNITSASVPYGVDEFPIAGVTATPSHFVKPPRVKESPIALECRYMQTVALPPAQPGGGPGYLVVFGLVVGVHIDDSLIKDGIVDIAAAQPIARLGYMDYSVVRPDTVFSIDRPEVDAQGRVVPPPRAAE